MAKADDLKAKIGLGGPPLERIDTAPPAIPDHQMVRRIGSGSYGDVWLARNAVGTWRAVKVVYRAQFKDTSQSPAPTTVWWTFCRSDATTPRVISIT